MKNENKITLKENFKVEMGKRITELRIEAGLTQQEVAEYLQMDRVSIGNIERGIQMLSTIDALLLTELFRININDLFYGVNSPTENKPIRATLEDIRAKWRVVFENEIKEVGFLIFANGYRQKEKETIERWDKVGEYLLPVKELIKTVENGLFVDQVSLLAEMERQAKQIKVNLELIDILINKPK